jgi:putative colanic acid biosynthesis acetyltransferase WcaF
MVESKSNIDYTVGENLLRLAWKLCESTFWRLPLRKFYWYRSGLLRLFGANVTGPINVFASSRIEIPWNLEAAGPITVGPRVCLYNLGKLSIGIGTVISQDVYICGGSHDYKKSGFPLLRCDITIANDVWICAGAFVGPGTTIGEGAIIAARAVVVADVEPWTIVGGNPAKVIGYRSDKSALAVPPESRYRIGELGAC